MSAVARAADDSVRQGEDEAELYEVTSILPQYEEAQNRAKEEAKVVKVLLNFKDLVDQIGAHGVSTVDGPVLPKKVTLDTGTYSFARDRKPRRGCVIQ
mmetsp:Transcript_4337/g.6811  ORF Transcript_4337/g.6811 Transcript_4337/m.6811 type:complete len:98 (+) Transcript_4337:31-324(+)